MTSCSAVPTFNSMTTICFLASIAKISIRPEGPILSLPPSLIAKPFSSCSMSDRNAACFSMIVALAGWGASLVSDAT